MSAPDTVLHRLVGLLLAAAACTPSTPVAVSPPGEGAPPEETLLPPRAPVLTPEAWLAVDTFSIAANTFNNPSAITMWGFSSCTANFASCAAPTVPGPSLQVQEGTSLTVHLKNRLVGPSVEPVSLVVPGQVASMQPVWVNPATGAVTGTGARPKGDLTSRVRSFNAETPADNATVVTYVFPAMKAGTYLYESGSHPAVQVQMGLYGAVSVYPATAGRAYDDPSSAFNTEATLVFSELDPVLHEAVATGHYGPNPNAPAAPPIGWVTSTMGYRAAYFLINGMPWSPLSPPLNGGTPNGRLLLRFLNAGLETKVPTLQGPYASVIAEDGNFITVTTQGHLQVPSPRPQYSVLLPAGKTLDALVTPGRAGDLAIYDRRLNLTNSGSGPGGLYAYFSVGTSNPLTQQVSLAPPFVFFPQTAVGHGSAGSLTVANAGLSSRAITGVSVVPLGSPVDASYFTVTFATPIAVAAGQSVSLVATYTPLAPGIQTALVEVTTNDPGAPVLTGLLFGFAH